MYIKVTAMNLVRQWGSATMVWLGPNCAWISDVFEKSVQWNFAKVKSVAFIVAWMKQVLVRVVLVAWAEVGALEAGCGQILVGENCTFECRLAEIGADQRACGGSEVRVGEVLPGIVLGVSSPIEKDLST